MTLTAKQQRVLDEMRAKQEDALYCAYAKAMEAYTETTHAVAMAYAHKRKGGGRSLLDQALAAEGKAARACQDARVDLMAVLAPAEASPGASEVKVPEGFAVCLARADTKSVQSKAHAEQAWVAYRAWEAQRNTYRGKG
jgi:hypothetical protein